MISTWINEGKLKVVTSDSEVQVIVPVGRVTHGPVKSSGGRWIRRWFHSLAPAEEQNDGFGYMRKKDAIEAIMVIVRAQGWLPK